MHADRIVFATLIVATIIIPFALIAWAMRPQICPHCGGAVEPKADLIQKLLG